jgi:hypothetical protein
MEPEFADPEHTYGRLDSGENCARFSFAVVFRMIDRLYGSPLGYEWHLNDRRCESAIKKILSKNKRRVPNALIIRKRNVHTRSLCAKNTLKLHNGFTKFSVYCITLQNEAFLDKKTK